MGEFATSLQLSHEFIDDEGNPAALIHISDAFEQAFNFSFGDIYKKKSEVFKRKPFNLTKALDYLRNLIIREKRNKYNQKDEKR